MMRIEINRNSDTATLRFSGTLRDAELVAIRAELRRLRPRLVFDLAEATLVDRSAVQFLAACEREGIELLRCPRYIREWIGRELSQWQP